MEKKHFVICLVFLLAVTVIFSSCDSDKTYTPYKKQIYALDTVIEFTVYDDNEMNNKKAVDQAVSEINRLENELSVSKNGDVYSINTSGGEKVIVHKETADLIKRSIDISEITGGLFDISVFPLMHLWGFDNKEYRIPDDDEIKKACELVDYKKIMVDDDTVMLDKDMKIDLGGIAKGYITEKAVDILKEYGVSSAVVNSGGNVYALGMKDENTPFVIGIQDPDDSSSYFARLDLTDRFAVTSGTYQRYFEEDGKIYHHIMDPFSGRPSDSRIKSVTIIGDDGTLCDAYSTALFIMGIDKATGFYADNKDFGFIILTDDNRMYVSSDISESIDLADGYDYEITVVN